MVQLIGDVVVSVDAVNAGGGIAREECVIFLEELVKLMRVESVLVGFIAFLSVLVT